MTRIRKLVELKNIHKWFGSVHALRGVNLDILRGEVLGVIGDNGAGKSTLVKIFSGIYPPDEGEIFWKGKKTNISSVNDARKLGIETVHQERGLVGNLSAAKNIFLGRELRKGFGFFKIVDHGQMDKESEKILKKLHLKLGAKQEARFFSGGEKQGIIVSRAMYFNAELVILDEPTRALSIKGVEQVRDFVNELKKKEVSCLFITHSFPHVFPVADRIVVLDRGKKVFMTEKRKIGSVSELEAKMLEIISAGEH